jgi:hypothetical protein
MGIGVVLIFYAIALTIAASISAAILIVAAHLLTKPSATGRKRLLITSALFPFACVLFAGVWFVFHRDPGLGDSWETPLPNGYALMMIDTTDQGTVYNPKTQPTDGSIGSRDDAVFGVRQLQLANNLIFGARDTGYFGRIGQESKQVDAYFELDTSKKTHIEFSSLDDLKQQAAKEGIALKLREFQEVFGDYRTTWFDYLAAAFLLIPPAIGFVLLLRQTWKVRKRAT